MTSHIQIRNSTVDFLVFTQDAHKTFSVDVYDPETGIIDPEVYEIFAVCRSRIRAGNSDAFSYYRYAGCTDEDTFHEYVAGVRSESIYETDIIPQ